MSAGLRYTGHALVDAGLAGITAYCHHDTPDEVTRDELSTWSESMLGWYASPAAKAEITVLFTTNSPWVSPQRKPEKQYADTREILFAWRDGPTGEAKCAYCGRPSLAGGEAAPLNGMAQRDLIPLLEGRPRMNFAPGGRSGLHVCGRCIAGIQALTVAAPMLSGKAVVADTPDAALRVQIAAAFVRHGLDQVARSKELGEKTPVKGRAEQWVVDTLAELYSGDAEARVASVTVYAISNSGQDPSVAVRPLTHPLVGWIRDAQTAPFRLAWRHLRERSRAAKYDSFSLDVARLPEALGSFLRYHVLPNAQELTRDSPSQGPASVPPLMPLVEKLLREVVQVTEDRVNAIRALSGRLAEEVQRGGPRLGRAMFRQNVRAYREVRDLLMRANSRRLNRGDDPVIGLDGFVTVFDEGLDEMPRLDWRLAWDLVTLGTAERLYGAGWFREHAAELPEEPEEDGSADALADGPDAADGEGEEDTWAS